MTRKKIKFDKSGKKVEAGKASPWLPPKHMRGLPEDYYTKDTSDGDRIHEWDAPHVVESIIAERDKAYEPKKESVADKLDSLSEDGTRTNLPFNQRNIDMLRFRVIWNMVRGALRQIQAGYGNEMDLSIKHLWFPNADFNEVYMRKGNPPPDADRPKHLRGKELWLDVLNWPQTIKDLMEKKGLPPINVADLLYKAKPTVDFDISMDDIPLEGLPQ